MQINVLHYLKPKRFLPGRGGFTGNIRDSSYSFIASLYKMELHLLIFLPFFYCHNQKKICRVLKIKAFSPQKEFMYFFLTPRAGLGEKKNIVRSVHTLHIINKPGNRGYAPNGIQEHYVEK